MVSNIILFSRAHSPRRDVKCLYYQAKELLRESHESVLKPFKIHSLDDGKFSCVLEFLMGRKVFVNRPTGSGTQLVVSILPGRDVKSLYYRANCNSAYTSEIYYNMGSINDF